MARPLTDGVPYFPLDTDFLQDEKVRLIKGEFGSKGVVILISLFSAIYRGNGYYKAWDNDSCLLMADTVGCGIVPENITQVVRGCLRRSVFDNGVFQMFGILTSAGIQRRYIRMFPSRKQILIYKEYWLLDVTVEKDVPEGVLKKLAFKSVKKDFNPDKNNANPDKNSFNDTNKKKEKKKRLNEGGAPNAPAPSSPSPTITRESLIAQYGETWVDIYLSKAAKKYHLTGDNALLKVAEWLAADKQAGKLDAPEDESGHRKRPASYDLEEYEQTVANFVPEYKKGGDT